MDDLNGMKPFAIRPTSVRMTTTAQTRCITFIVVREKSSFCTGRSTYDLYLTEIDCFVTEVTTFSDT